MIEHMKHNKFNALRYNPDFQVWCDGVDVKVNQLIRVVNELSVKNLTPAKKKKLEKINLLKKQLKQLEMEL
jgi:hypothetical protein